MKTIIKAAFTRTRTILLLFIMLLIWGFIAYEKIPKESDPDVQIPFIIVSVYHQGISAEDAARLIAKPLEKELTNVEGIKNLTSTSEQGTASIILEFEAGFNSDKALRDAQTKVDSIKSKLPENSDEPIVRELNVALFPILSIILSGDLPERELIQRARNLKDSLENIDEIFEITIDGDRTDLIEIIINPQILETYSISPEEVFRIVDENNKLIAAGSLQSGSGKITIKIPGIIENIADIENLPVKAFGLESVLFKDIATIQRTYKDPSDFVRMNGKKAITLNITKRIGANIIETIERVREQTAIDTANWPKQINITYNHDNSKKVINMLGDLENNILSAIFLVMVIIIAFLGVRSGLLVGLAIPGSFLTAILVLFLLDYTTNIVILFSLILVVGMLVDGAIVITELANRSMATNPSLTAKQAYQDAAIRMAWPITSSVLTTMLVFTPLLFWPGLIGEFMKFLPLTVIITLSISLLMTLIFLPVIGGILGRPKAEKNSYEHSLAPEEHLKHARGFSKLYLNLLEKSLTFPTLTLIIVFGLTIGIYTSYFSLGKGVEFFPDIEADYAKIQVRARGNLSIYEKDILLQKVEKKLNAVSGIKNTYTKTLDRAPVSTGDSPPDLIGYIEIEYLDWKLRKPPSFLLQEVRAATNDIPGIQIEILEDKGGPSSGKPIRLEFSSKDFSQTENIAKAFQIELEKLAGIVDIENSLSLPGIEWHLNIDRAKAAEYGINASLLGSTIQLVTHGIKLAEYHPEDTNEEVEIRVRFPKDDRHLQKLLNLKIPSNEGLIPIQNFVTLIPAAKTNVITRKNSNRIIIIKANIDDAYLASDKFIEIKDLIDSEKFDPQIKIDLKGESADQDEAGDFLAKAFFIALFLMLILLVTQFNSIFQSLLILSAIVSSTAGVLLGLLITGQPFGIVMCGIGVIALSGIVVNNNIILIDTYNAFKAKNYDIKTALLLTGSLRLRPVLLTSITTIIGLLPMVLSLNIDFFERNIDFGSPSTQWWNQLSISIAGGLAFATILTLLLTPSLIMLGHKIGSKFTKNISKT